VSESTCCDAEASANANDAPFVSYKAACQAAHSTCTDAGPALPFWCKPELGVYKPALLTALATCFQGECGVMTKCLSAKVNALGCN